MPAAARVSAKKLGAGIANSSSASARGEWLSASPAQVISRALALVRDGEAITRALLEQGLTAVGTPAAGNPMTGIRIESYECKANWDGVPADLLPVVCRGHRFVQKVIIGGGPGILRDGKALSGDTAFEDRFWYRFDQLQSDAARLRMSLGNVSAAYDGKVAYDLPPTTLEYRVGELSDRLVIAVVGAGRNPAGARTDVISISMYQPLPGKE